MSKILRGTMNGTPLGQQCDIPLGMILGSGDLSDVDRACTKWLMENSAEYRASRLYFSRQKASRAEREEME